MAEPVRLRGVGTAKGHPGQNGPKSGPRDHPEAKLLLLLLLLLRLLLLLLLLLIFHHCRRQSWPPTPSTNGDRQCRQRGSSRRSCSKRADTKAHMAASATL